MIAPTAEHTHTVVILHGRGSSGREFRDEFFESTGSDGQTIQQRLPMIKWVLPKAKERFSTVFKEPINEWFDIYSLSDPESRQDLQDKGLAESISQIRSILDRELESVQPSKLFLGGISQGCATATHTLLSQSNALAGFIGISSWLPFASKLEGIASLESGNGVSEKLFKFYSNLFAVLEGQPAAETQNSTSGSSALATPMFLCHGIDDDVVDISLGHKLRDVASALGLNVIWKEDDECGHWIKEPEAVNELAEFLRHQIASGP